MDTRNIANNCQTNIQANCRGFQAPRIPWISLIMCTCFCKIRYRRTWGMMWYFTCILLKCWIQCQLICLYISGFPPKIRSKKMFPNFLGETKKFPDFPWPLYFSMFSLTFQSSGNPEIKCRLFICLLHSRC